MFKPNDEVEFDYMGLSRTGLILDISQRQIMNNVNTCIRIIPTNSKIPITINLTLFPHAIRFRK